MPKYHSIKPIDRKEEERMQLYLVYAYGLMVRRSRWSYEETEEVLRRILEVALLLGDY